MFSKQCATPNNHLPFHIVFQRTRQEIVCPTQKFPDRETFCFGLSACHILCGSQKGLTAATVSFCQHPTFRNEVPPALTRAFTAWRFLPVLMARHKKHHASLSSPAHRTFISSCRSAGKNPPAALVCARPRSHQTSLRIFCCRKPTRIIMPHKKSCTLRPVHSCLMLSRSASSVALAGNPLRLISFLASRFLIARNEILQAIGPNLQPLALLRFFHFAYPIRNGRVCPPLQIISLKLHIFIYTHGNAGMPNDLEKELLNYYRDYCALTIRGKKILLQSNPDYLVTIEDITKEFIIERNRLLLHFPTERRRMLRMQLGKIATSYYSQVSHWPKKRNITVDMAYLHQI